MILENCVVSVLCMLGVFLDVFVFIMVRGFSMILISMYCIVFERNFSLDLNMRMVAIFIFLEKWVQ